MDPGSKHQKLELCLPFDPEITCLGIYPNNKNEQAPALLLRTPSSGPLLHNKPCAGVWKKGEKMKKKNEQEHKDIFKRIFFKKSVD
jgi:hypothetical protein